MQLQCWQHKYVLLIQRLEQLPWFRSNLFETQQKRPSSWDQPKIEEKISMEEDLWAQMHLSSSVKPKILSTRTMILTPFIPLLLWIKTMITNKVLKLKITCSLNNPQVQKRRRSTIKITLNILLTQHLPPWRFLIIWTRLSIPISAALGNNLSQSEQAFKVMRLIRVCIRDTHMVIQRMFIQLLTISRVLEISRLSVMLRLLFRMWPWEHRLRGLYLE